MKIHYVRPIDLHDYAPRCDNDPCRPVVEKADYDALAARLAEAEALLRRAMQAVEFYDSNFCSDGPQLLPKIESFLSADSASVTLQHPKSNADSSG